METSYTTQDSYNYRTTNNQQTFIKSDQINYTDLYAAATLSYRPDFYNTHYIKATYNDRTVSDTLAFLNPDLFLDGSTQQQFFRLTYQLTHDRRDFASYPLEGQFGEIGIHQQGFGIVSNFARTELYGNFAKYWTLDKQERFFVASRLSGRTSFPDTQPYNFVQALGYGKEFVRGYEKYVIDGQHFLLHKTNLKFRVFRTEINLGKWMPLTQFRKIPLDLYVKTYYDHGQVWNANPGETNLALTNRYLYGTGIGMELVTFYDVVWRVEYSRNHLGEWQVFYGTRADL